MMVDNLCMDDPYFYQACGSIATYNYNPLMDSEYSYSFSILNSGKKIYYVVLESRRLVQGQRRSELPGQSP